ncbi:hypothetical protein EU538_11855 [Candidatus Thorarchaeota archaeon]|nr:MAG: hypothetical protein EU538_11855 [Candidatus Thorarchaeota archaeon]
MGSAMSESEISRKVRYLEVFFFLYLPIIFLFILSIPEEDVIRTTSPTLFSLVLIPLMPFELFLIYVFKRMLLEDAEGRNIIGVAALMYVLAVAPSIYAFLISVLDSFMRYAGVTLGFVFSLVGFIYVRISLSEQIQNSELTYG